ncbi:MAG: DUF6557 family protein [Gammaproteobacteria bacterium]|nr:DUF6557 family protein [Gammaproteobacteria bacterium]
MKAALLWCYPEESDSLEAYRLLYGKLKRIDREQSKMRIIVKDTYRPKIDDEPFIEVIGRNGERNRDQADFEHILANAEPGWADEETDFSLSYHRWAEWLGMSIDSGTLESVPLPQIAAHCMSDMTFHGFEEADAQAVLEEVKERAAELDAMTPEEREKALIPHEEVMKAMKSKFENE